MDDRGKVARFLAGRIVQQAITRSLLERLGHSGICCTHLEREPCGRCHRSREARWERELVSWWELEQLRTIAAEEDRQWQ